MGWLNKMRKKDRLVVVDTETTGLSPSKGERVIEIGLLEIVDRQIGRSYQTYLNPQTQDVSYGAYNVHKIPLSQLHNAPTFDQVVGDICKFIHTSPILFHYAKFDVKFLRAECDRIDLDFNEVFGDVVLDTRHAGVERFPISSRTLDNMCRMYGIDLSSREHGHGALVDCHLTAQLYLRMTQPWDWFPPKKEI